MIGVIANPKELRIVEEFFQLFKTPWEPYRAGRTYDVVIAGQDAAAEAPGVRLRIVHGAEGGVAPSATVPQALATVEGEEIPLYTSAMTGPAPGYCAKQSSQATLTVQLGYQLWAEIEYLLTIGQPASHAAIPTLDRHIQILRKLMVQAGLVVVEIPPAPAGRPFICCLTHDIDFLRLRQHRFDHTMAGFLYRATVGSIIDWTTGRKTVGEMSRNVLAALQLPLVQMGVAEDYWEPFSRYLQVEGGKPSTFFIIPIKNRPGSPCGRTDHAKRGVRYDVTEIPRYVKMVQEAGCEVALHGIDAWSAEGAARDESARMASVTGEPPAGVRMHWLYFDKGSHELLDRAGFQYESTSGYNEAAGYKAGTTQVFRPLSSTRMLELPMHVQDCALFFPDRMNLRPGEAWELCERIMDHAAEAGGTVTLNWHDRSLVPERLWGSFYESFLKRLDERGAWFATAKQAVEWFGKRRQIQFQNTRGEGDDVVVSLAEVPATQEEDVALRLTWSTDSGQLRQVEAAIGGRRHVRLSLSEGVSPRDSIRHSGPSGARGKAEMVLAN